MNLLRGLILFVLISLFSCGSNISGTTSETDIGIMGTILDGMGTPVSEATVVVYSISGDSTSVAVDTVTTNAKGEYNFPSLSSGTYFIEGMKDINGTPLKVVVYEIVYDSVAFADSILHVGTDTLIGTGALKGVVRPVDGAVVGVDIYIPGTSYLAKSAADGSFLLSDIPQAVDYTLRCSYTGYQPKEITPVSVTIGDTTSLADTIILQYDPDGTVGDPQGLKANYDIANHTVSLSWNSITHPNFDGFIVYRKDSSKSADSPEKISGSSLITVTNYVDTVSELYVGEKIVYQYQLTAQDKKANQSGYSIPVYVTVEGTKSYLPDTAKLSVPLDGAVDVAEKPLFKWNDCGAGVIYKLHVWEIGGLIDDTMKFETSGLAYQVGGLRYSQKYGARVESINDSGSVMGPEISFTIEDESVARIIGSKFDVKETFIASGVPGNTSSYTDDNYGALEWFTVGEHDQRTLARALVHFNQNRLPSKSVASAKLVLKVSHWVDHSHENSAPMTLAVHKMLKVWNEGDSLPTSGLHENTHQIILDGLANSAAVDGASAKEATWGTSWNEDLVALDGKDAVIGFIDTVSHAMSEGTEILWEFDVTDVVNEWIASPTTNKGLLLKGLTEDWNGKEVSFPVFYSWEHTDSTDHGPKLILG